MFDNIKKLENGSLMHEVWDIPYNEKFKFDFYGPTKDKGPFPCFIYIHGGGIKDGNKGGIGSFCHEFIKKGYGFFSIDYPMYPNTKFPEYLVSSAQAVKFIFEHASEYGCNGDIYLMGQSAGAYILLMLMANKKYFEDIGFDHRRIKGYIAESGTCTDHITILEMEKGISPYMTRITECSPIYYIDDKFSSSPVLLTFNTDDQFLNRDNGNKILYNQIKFFTNVDAEIVEIKGSHCAGSVIPNPDGTYDFNKAVFEWLKTH